MVKNDVERYQWFKEQKAMSATPGCEAVLRGGRDFARTLAKICPHCDAVFYAYQVLGQERQPNRRDPLPVPGDAIQTRETCGSPKCWEDELAVKFRRDQAARPPRQAQSTGPATAKLVRRGEPQPLRPLKETMK